MENKEEATNSVREMKDQILKADKAEAILDIKKALLARDDRGPEEEELIALSDAALAHLKSKKGQRILSIVCVSVAAAIAAFVIYVLTT